MEVFGVNKCDVMNQICQFGSKFDCLCNVVGGGGGGCNVLKWLKVVFNLVLCKSNVFNEQVCYVWYGVLQDLKSMLLVIFLMVMVIVILLILLSVCYMVYKNVSSVVFQYYFLLQIIVYLEKMLDDDVVVWVVGQLQVEQGVDKVNYLFCDEVLGEFCNWFGFGGVLDMLEENLLLVVVIVVLKLDFQSIEVLNILCDWVLWIQGVDEVWMDDSWFVCFFLFIGLVGCVLVMIGVLMVVVVFLVIGNSVCLSIFVCCDIINVQKFIGVIDGFILCLFFYGGVMLGFFGVFLLLILLEILVMCFLLVVIEVVKVFGIQFELSGLGFDECLLMLIVCLMIGWVVVWLVIV